MRKIWQRSLKRVTVLQFAILNFDVGSVDMALVFTPYIAKLDIFCVTHDGIKIYDISQNILKLHLKFRYIFDAGVLFLSCTDNLDMSIGKLFKSSINSLTPGIHKKFTHTKINLQLKAAGVLKYV